MDLTVHPLYAHTLRFLDNAAAREKLLRLLQYAVRTLNARGAGLKALQTQLTLARKPLRAFRGLTHLRNVVRLLRDEIMDPLLKWASVLRELAMGLYFSLDTLQYLQLLRLWRGPPQLKRWCGIAWSLGLTAALAGCLRRWQMCLNKNNKHAVAKLKKDTLKTVMDIPIAYSQVWDLGVEEAVLGGLGVATSALALEDLWANSAN